MVFPIDNNCYYDYACMKSWDGNTYKFPSLKPTVDNGPTVDNVWGIQ